MKNYLMKPFYISKTMVLIFSLLFASDYAYSQKVELKEDVETVEVNSDAEQEPTYKPRTGKKAAQKYFLKKEEGDEDDSSKSNGGVEEHFIMFGLGAFIDSKSYKWGSRTVNDPGELNLNVTYRFGQWTNSMDFLIRMDFQTYDVESNKDPSKLSVIPMIIFPDADSQYPVYFGAGAGLGVFFKQIDDESSLSFDYQLFVGARVFDVFDSLGFFTEVGLKNHIHLLSSGQFNGVFFNIGSVSTF